MIPPFPDPGSYDLFVSYCTKDNLPPPGGTEGWVQVFIKRVRALSRSFTNVDLTTTANVEAGWDTFYAPDGIHAGDAWETRLRTAIAHSRVLLACLSEHYWESKWCRFEWETYLEQESARGLANVEGGITPIYIATRPGLSKRDIVAAAPAWAQTLLAKRQVRLIEFDAHAADAFARIQALRDDPTVALHLQAVADNISQQLEQAHRAERMAHQGNLAEATQTFVGRTDELHAIEGQLFGGGALGVITALHGLGGQGKTALALRYGQNLRSRYLGGTWQIIAEGAHELLPLLATLRESLALPPIATDDDAATARRVLTELHRRTFASDAERGTGFPAAALLVVDNVDHPGLIAQAQWHLLHAAMREAGLGADHGWLHLLATTRLERHQLPASLKADSIIPVDALPETDALALWTRLLANEPGKPLLPAELDAAKAIITLLERHTLAVEITARLIRRSFGEIAVSHLAKLRAALSTQPGTTAGALGLAQRAQQSEQDLPGYTHALRATLAFTFQHLQAEQPAALTVLHYAAHFPAESVPLPWLRILAGQQHPALLEEAQASGLLSEWDKAHLRLSQSLRLLTHADGEAEEISRLHRLAAEFLRYEAQQAREDEARVRTVENFIQHRCALAEHDNLTPFQPWERSILRADLPARMEGKDCTNHMARQGLVLGQILTSYDDLATARRLYLAANNVMQRLADSDPDNAVRQRDLSISLNKLGELSVAQGDLAVALRYFTDGKTIAQRIAATDPDNAEWQRDLSIALEKLGELAVAQGDLAGASRYFTRSQTIAKKLADSDPDNAQWKRDLSVSLNKLGDLAVAQGDLAGGFRYFSGSNAIAEQLADKDPDNGQWKRDLSISLNKLGDLAVAQGDLAGALRSFTQSKSIADRLAASDPDNAQWKRDLSVSLNKLGELAVAHGELGAALRHFMWSKTIRDNLAESDPANAVWQHDLAVSLIKLGDLAVAQGDSEGALGYFTEGKNIVERLAVSDPTNAGWQRGLSVFLERVGDLAVAQGDGDAALSFFTESKNIAERLAASDPANAAWQRDLSLSLSRLGNLAVAQGDLAGALRHFTDGKIIVERLAASDPTHAVWQRDLAFFHFKLFQFAQKSGDKVMMHAELHACFIVLDAMRKSGLHMDSPSAKIYAELFPRFTQP